MEIESSGTTAEQLGYIFEIVMWDATVLPEYQMYLTSGETQLNWKIEYHLNMH